MKKYILGLLLVSVGLGAVLFMRETTRWPVGPLSELQGQVNSEADKVFKAGQDAKITFILPGENGTLVISPPYANISGLGKNVFSPALLKKCNLPWILQKQVICSISNRGF